MDLPALMEHSGAVLIVIVFLTVAIGVTLVMSTTGGPVVRKELEGAGSGQQEGKEARD